MPQLDFYSFATQIFWFLVFFIALYLFAYYNVLPKFSSGLKFREKLKSFLDIQQRRLKNLYDTFIKLFHK